jgi:hypothetical protein
VVGLTVPLQSKGHMRKIVSLFIFSTIAMLAQDKPKVEPKAPELNKDDQILWLQIQLKQLQTYTTVRQQFGTQLDANDKAQSEFLTSLNQKCGTGFTPSNQGKPEGQFLLPFWSCVAVAEPAKKAPDKK